MLSYLESRAKAKISKLILRPRGLVPQVRASRLKQWCYTQESPWRWSRKLSLDSSWPSKQTGFWRLLINPWTARQSGQPDMQETTRKHWQPEKPLNVKDTHSNRHLYGRTTQLLAQIEKLWRRRLCSSLERIIEAKSNSLYQW